jgi:hypothetical protein
MQQPFCIDCRSALRGVEACEPDHRVVDLADAHGRESLRIETYRRNGHETAPVSAWSWFSLGRLPSGTLLLIGGWLVATGHVPGGLLVGVLAAGTITAGLLRSGRSSSRVPLLRPLGARVAPPWIAAPRLVGKIVSGTTMRAPFGSGECVGWALSVTLAEGGVMLLDGQSHGFDVELRDGRLLTVRPGMLRLALGARSDTVSSDEIAGHVSALAREEALIPWGEARAVVLSVGDRVEIAADASGDARGSSSYRDAAGATLATTGIPSIRRA